MLGLFWSTSVMEVFLDMRGGIARGLAVALVTVFAVACEVMNVPTVFVISIDVADTRQGIVDIRDMTGAGWTSFASCSCGLSCLLLFSQPTGVIRNGAGFLVVDRSNNRIVLVPLGVCASIGSAGSGIGQFMSPSRITSDTASRAYVTDTGNNRLVRFDDISGSGWITFGSAGSGINQFSAPDGIHVDTTGRIYVADTGNNRLVRINDLSGAGWTTFGSAGSGINQFSAPAGISLDTAGRIYVADTGNNRLVRINDMNGVGWTTFGSAGIGVNQFSAPFGVSVDAAGRIYVADCCTNSRIVRINDMTGVGWTTCCTGTHQFVSPTDIVVQSQ